MWVPHGYGGALPCHVANGNGLIDEAVCIDSDHADFAWMQDSEPHIDPDLAIRLNDEIQDARTRFNWNTGPCNAFVRKVPSYTPDAVPTHLALRPVRIPHSHSKQGIGRLLDQDNAVGTHTETPVAHLLGRGLKRLWRYRSLNAIYYDEIVADPVHLYERYQLITVLADVMVAVVQEVAFPVLTTAADRPCWHDARNRVLVDELGRFARRVQ
jgi:hypothetical protein